MRRAGRIFAASDGGKPGALPASGDARAEPVAAFGPFHDLPSSLVAEVIALLDGPSVAKLGMTCRRMREETRSSAIWRTLARRQEPSALVREDLVTRDFTWRHLYAWRRHVLAHCDPVGVVDRIAVADASRVLTCDPVEGGGCAYVVHETHAPETIIPNTLAWSRGGELLSVLQEGAPDGGSKVLVAAPPAMLRHRQRVPSTHPTRPRRGGGEESDADEDALPGGTAKNDPDANRSRREPLRERLGDEDSTAAGGYAAGDRGDLSSDEEEVVGGRGGFRTGGSERVRNRIGASVEDASTLAVDARATDGFDGFGGGGVVSRRRRVTALPAVNAVSLPSMRNPVFAAFAPCGTRLAVMDVRGRGDEIALSVLDLTTSLASLYGAPGARIVDRGRDAPPFPMSREARETLTLVEVAKEISFSFGPASADAVTLVDGVDVGRVAARCVLAPEPPVSGLLDETNGSHRGRRSSDSDADSAGSPRARAAKRAAAGPPEGTLSDAPEERGEGRPSDDAGASPFGANAPGVSARGVSRTFASPFSLRTTDSDDEEGDEREVSSAAESAWWRRSMDAAARRLRGGAEAVGGALRFFSLSGGGGPNSFSSAADPAASPRAAKRRRLAGGTVAASAARGTGAGVVLGLLRGVVGGGGGLIAGSARRGGASSSRPRTGFGGRRRASSSLAIRPARPIPSHRVARLVAPEAATGAFRRAPLHTTQLDGMSHVVQWIRPAVGADGRRRNPRDPFPDGFWLAPASFADAVPQAVHLALVPATRAPGPEELRGSDEERAEAARRAMMRSGETKEEEEEEKKKKKAPQKSVAPTGAPGALVPAGTLDTLTASIAEGAESRSRRDASAPFAARALRRHVAAELSPPAVYNELHVAVPLVASASPGGGIVCWADETALWARKNTARDRAVGDAPPAEPVLFLQTCGFGAGADPAGGNPVLHHVQAMQWTRGGDRLLFLLTVHVTTAQHVYPLHQWVVWDPPESWLRDDGDEEAEEEAEEEDRGGLPGEARRGRSLSRGMSSLSRGRWHVPSGCFLQDCLPIFEQYAQTHDLWNLAGDAIVYPTRNDAEGVEQIEMQRFPRRGEGPGAAVEFPATTRQRDAGLPFRVRPTPEPVVVCEGSFCVWSPR